MAILNITTAPARWFFTLCLLLMPAGVSSGPAYEQPREYRAGAVLSPEMVKGKYHVVNDQVLYDGFFYHFNVQSDFGPFQVVSIRSLAVLIHELQAIAAMNQVKTSDTVVQSMQKSGENTLKGLKKLFNDPEETMRGAGQGINSLFNRASATITRRQLTESEDSRMEQLVGLTKSKGEIATKFGVSIYSQNKVLQNELDRLAMADYFGGLGVGLATSVVPGVSGLVLTTSGTARLLNETINTTSPSELWLQNEKKLLAMGINADTIELFLNNPVFTPALHTVLVTALETLEGASNRELFIKVGLQASTPVMAKLITETAVMAAGYHKNIEPLKNFSPMARLLQAEKQDGTVVILLPTDHLIWTQRIASLADNLTQQRPAGKNYALEVWTLGTLSDTARSTLKSMGWQIHEKAQNALVPQLYEK